MSFKPTVRTGTDPKFYTNNLAFATREEAERSAKDLMSRWMLVVEWGVEESDEPVNYRLREDGALEDIVHDIGEGPAVQMTPVETKEGAVK